MAGALGLYVLFHSPLRGPIAALAGGSSHQCFFACAPELSAQSLVSAATALLLAVAALAAASRLTAVLLLREVERAPVWGTLALGLIVVPAAYVAGIGSVLALPLLRPPVGPLLAAAPAALIAFALRGRGWYAPRVVNAPDPSPLLAVFVACALVLFVAASAVAVAHPPDGYDALSYHGPLSVYLWRDGTLDAWLRREPDASALAHPGAAELWAGLVRIVAGERFANLSQLPFALIGAASVAAIAGRMGFRSSSSALAATAFLLAPMVVLQSGVQVSDLAAGALLMTAAALALAGEAEWTMGRAALVGAVMGLAVTTKLALLPGVAAVQLYAAVRLVRARRAPLLAVAAAAFLVVVFPWWFRNAALFGNPIYPAAIPFIGRGYVVGDFIRKDRWFVPTPKAWPLYPLLELHSDSSGFGALFAVGALPGALMWGLRRREVPALWLLLLGVSIPAWWRLTQHEPRMLLGVAGIGFAFVPAVMVGMRGPTRCIAAALLADAAVFSTGVTLDQLFRSRLGLPTDRAEFYEVAWGIDSTVAGLPEEIGILDQTGLVPLSYAADYALLGSHRGRTIATIDGLAGADSVVGLLRRHGMRYVYVPFSADRTAEVDRAYDDRRFELVGRTVATRGVLAGAERRLYRSREVAPSSPPGPR